MPVKYNASVLTHRKVVPWFLCSGWLPGENRAPYLDFCLLIEIYSIHKAMSIYDYGKAFSSLLLLLDYMVSICNVVNLLVILFIYIEQL